MSQHSGLITFEVTGKDIDDAARRLRRMPGVEAAAVFGRALHVAGTDRAALESAIRATDSTRDDEARQGASLDGAELDGAELDGAKLSWQEVEPRLEDVFIHMLSMDQNRRASP